MLNVVSIRFVKSCTNLSETEFGDEGSASSIFRPNKKPSVLNKSKKPRPARRNQSKSEPSLQSAQESIRRPMDGTSEAEWTGSGSGDGSLPLSPSRSVCNHRLVLQYVPNIPINFPFLFVLI